MKNMKNFKVLEVLFIALFVGVLISCNNDDDRPDNNHFHPNGIKVLTASTINVTASTYQFGDDPLRTVNSVDIGEVNGDSAYVLASNEQVTVSVNEDATPNGALVLFILSKTNYYIGQNFTVNVNGEVAILTGQVSNNDDVNDIKDLIITIQESQLGAGSSEFTINNDEALLSGTLGTHAYNQILEINADYPNVETIVLGSIDGSVNDDVNVETGRLIREAGYTAHLKSDSEIYSGGVDLFCSGLKRVREAGSVLGVHSWCCYQGLTADQLPEDSQGHDSQLTYFKEMLGTTNGPAFYYYTINAATFDDVHTMTDAEIEQYGLVTE
jgi:hypothetical protein